MKKMDKKILGIIIAVVAIIVVAVAGIIVIDFLTPKADFENNFMKGKIYGIHYIEDNNTYKPDFEDGYKDPENGITYYFLAVKNSTFIVDMFTHFGMSKISSKDYNGNTWDIYYLDLKNAPGYFGSLSIGTGYFLKTNKNGVDYIVAVTSYKTKTDNTLDSELFTGYVDPLVSSLTLKDVPNAPEIYKLLGMSKSQFNTVVKYVETNGWDSVK
jgi:hypothetical protein